MSIPNSEREGGTVEAAYNNSFMLLILMSEAACNDVSA